MKRHEYVPDAMAQGDCRVCGQVHDAEVHRGFYKRSECPRCKGTGAVEMQDFYDDGTPSRSVSEWPCGACL